MLVPANKYSLSTASNSTTGLTRPDENEHQDIERCDQRWKALTNWKQVPPTKEFDAESQVNRCVRASVGSQGSIVRGGHGVRRHDGSRRRFRADLF